MLILPKSCFLHIPKTGGTWVRKAVLAAGIPAREYHVGDNFHPGLADCPCPEKFRFAFVRHPLELYRSYWRFKMGVGWDPGNAIDRECARSDFGAFVACMLEKQPGIYSRSLELYVGPPEAPIDFVGRYENLVEDLVTALQRAGESFDPEAIRCLPATNVSDKQAFPADYPPELEAAVRRAEAPMMQRFGYD